MALFEMKFQPRVDKQDTGVGATDRWVDSDNSRWRYSLPEKVGRWSPDISLKVFFFPKVIPKKF